MEFSSSESFSLADLGIGSQSQQNTVVEPVVEEQKIEVPTSTPPTQTTITPTTVPVEDNVVVPVENGEQQPTTTQEQFADTLMPFAKFLSEKGFLNLTDKDGNEVVIKDYTQLGEVLKSSIDSNRYGDLTESQTRYMEALEHGIPLSKFEEVERKLQGLNGITEEVLAADKQAQFDLIYTDFINKGISEDKAVLFANATMNDEAGALLEAKTIIQGMVSKATEEYNALKTSTAESNKATLESITKIANETKDVLGIPFTPELKEKVLKSMTTRAGQSEAGVPMNAFDKWRTDNKEKADLILHTLMSYTDGFTKLDKVKGVVKSDATKELDNILKGQIKNDKQDYSSDVFRI